MMGKSILYYKILEKLGSPRDLHAELDLASSTLMISRNPGAGLDRDYDGKFK